MPITFTEVVALDMRFPTSDPLDGSDAMNKAPDYSAAYVTRKTDHPDGLEGHGISFTTGRGNELCPHAGGVGLCEDVQHLAIFDDIAVTGSLEDRVVEYVDHLHEHFEAPAIVQDDRYVAPSAPGYSITMRPESLRRFAYPGGEAWAPVTASGRSR